MKIKHPLLALFCMCITFGSYAQTSDDEAEAIVVLLGVQKKQAVAQLVSVTGKDSATFWKLYDEYNVKNRATAKNRLQLYEQTASAYAGMSAATADSLAARYFSNREGQEKTLQEYYKKIKAATNAVLAFEFYQAEVYILTQLRAQIMQQIPTYGQVVKSFRGH
jgi:DNA polymerase/3'-5' exonuclease PolX